MELEDISFQFLREITDGFSEERILGEGAFGVVYKGVTKNGDDVAVKIFKLPNINVNHDLKQFQNEFYNLTKLKHENIVQILGYCYEIEKKPFIMDGSKLFVDETHIALCFEYLHNGSLQKHLSDGFYELDWHTRFKIIKGICVGLKYIHDELQEPIYHLDLKPDNILLDKEMVPKIADFGLSRIFSNELARITQNPYGTRGYQPPEYIDKGEISGKFDIFSLGVVIIKIVSGPEGYPKCLDISTDEFIDQIQRDWRSRLEATCTGDLLEAYCHQVETCTQIALKCVVTDSQKRPDIVKINEKLNELEIDIDKVHKKGCLRHVSKMTMHNSKIEMRTESKDIIDPHQNIILWSHPSCNELELHDALETPSHVIEEHIVGRTEEKEKVMASLHEVISERIVILPIHGIGGIGKTTFARLIYNEPKFRCYSQVWIDVSQEFGLTTIRESMILQLSSKESLANDRPMIHYGLTELISHKKIMIVLDDVWEDNQFQLQELKDMLYHDDSNIIVLVTTRSEVVAERICTNLQPHKILALTNDMCWDIIKQRSDFNDRNDKEQLMGIGLEIARKCSGVALAALSLGFTLRSMNFEEWMKVKDSDIWNEPVSKDFSLSNHVLASLMLSYRYMSPCLKLCFTYCATFPKDHKIVKDDLIYQWIGLDFIKPTKLLSHMQLCEKYIVQLLGLSFFQQPVSPKTSEAYYEQATFFTMHDLVHDLAISLLGNQILDQSKQSNTGGSSCQYALLRDCSRPLEYCLTSHARLVALRFLEGCRSKLSGAAFAPARSLRVLDLSECSIQRLPDSIGQLKQLRYLNAPKIQKEFVPECITELSNLIYLNLQGSRISCLPESIGELERLMHLDLSYCSNLKLPNSFRNLEKLVHLDLSYCRSISGVLESLQCLSRLEHLNLSSCRKIGDVTRVMIGLTELQYLNLSEVPCVGLQQVLVNLTKLRYLNLEGSLGDGLDEDEIGSLLECVGSLSNLEYLNLGRNDDLRTIPESIGNLRKLNTLDLLHCKKLQMLPASVSAINTLKFLHVYGCRKLDKSTLPQNKNSTTVLLPHFVVHAGDGESSSNISELEDKHPTFLEISRLENAKSAEEAKRIKLVEKQSIEKLELAWTRDAMRFADDREVLSGLVPPDTLGRLTLEGYNSISFPSWLMSIATYLPRLRNVTLRDLPSCNVLPPLGQLPILGSLSIRGMDSIRKIDGGFYGGRRAFPKLVYFSLSHMECLEEWNATYSSDVDDLNELAFPKLRLLSINRCPLLRFNACTPPGITVIIDSSDQALLSQWENRGHVSASSSAATKQLYVKCCEVPLHQWNLLRHLPCLTHVNITDCSGLTWSSTDLLQCISSLETLFVVDCKNSTVALPERLGELTSLKRLVLRDCNGITSLPESIQQLTCLHRLEINGCPGLVQWCKSEENKMKLAHIEEITTCYSRKTKSSSWRKSHSSLTRKILDGKRLRVIRRPCVTWQEPKLKNKGSPTTTMEDLENMTRDAVGIDTNHPTRLLSLEYGFSKAQEDDSNYEREASKQWSSRFLASAFAEKSLSCQEILNR
ncbi:disease resistance protein RGA2-like isoform X4 [Panicum virgatum]|uniref:disease resistance protein RGA2-like isoform X4 n=1 Tax=Panicum virgatum TaxID=38727 RepID=UPI0019D55BF3|nr:disease resistance protein RGA2-like isoform X4 [Panicum virgatum]